MQECREQGRDSRRRREGSGFDGRHLRAVDTPISLSVELARDGRLRERRRSAIFESHLFGSARSVANVIGFARRSSGLARWVALIVLFCVTSPYERAYAMNDRPDSFQPKTGQTVYPQWWSSTAPDGEEFELPSGTKTCSRLKVRFVGEIIMVAARVGPTYPYEASFLVEDNFGDQQYGSGKIIKGSFYHRYNDVHFGRSEINRKLGPQDYWFQDRNDANHILLLRLGADVPQTPVSYVCAFKEGEQVLLSYFLKRSPPHPWPY
ncbi:MAG: hypothetical protein QOI10_3720 [Solirubrobacterales bacterium]|jgi:hypothetical protein|nr:hypothetical protein [Solirubrobacterales bacterium]